MIKPRISSQIRILAENRLCFSKKIGFTINRFIKDNANPP